MRKIYRVLAVLIAVEVVVQAAAIALAFAGLDHWLARGGVADGDTLDGGTRSFTGAVGFVVHGVNGGIVVPVLALVLLGVSFFAHVPRGSVWAAGVLALVVVQTMLGYSAADLPALGAVHGINALLLFAAASLTARRARLPRSAPVAEQAETADTGP